VCRNGGPVVKQLLPAWLSCHECMHQAVQCSLRTCCSRYAPERPMLAFMVPTTEPRLLGQLRTCSSQQGDKRSGCRLVEGASSRRRRQCAYPKARTL
jgi:hypothetical protein